MQKEVRDIIILGAGPSGLFCGLHLPKQAKILFLEKTEKSASKLLLSAKGRGNLTNLQIDPKQDYVSDDPAFVHSAFEKYGVREFLQFLAENGFPTQEEANGRILLQSGKVSQFHEFLINETEKQGRIIAYQQDVKKVERNAEGTFTVQTTSQQFIAHKVILATGTKSVPALGSSDIALQIAQDFNLPFRVFFPALVGFETENNLSPLAGSSVIGKGELYVNEKKVYEQI
ncbi:MAG: NAD(P)/FAD-dependent oxidoreductase [Candidatus Peribacteria bacterium]|jgi:predicted Rossmann fold flavoprotein|nr:NAD(P)/FAD-dependent oxidoreductase [Candidatus Peribacteria bacterium]